MAPPKIIDFRLRPPVAGFLDMIMFSNGPRRDRATRMHGFEPAESAAEQSMPKLIQEMDRAGIATGVVIGRFSGAFGSVSNDDVRAVVTNYPGHFVGVASIDPTDRKSADRQITQAIAEGFVALNIEPASYPVLMKADDRRLYPIYARCEDEGFPVIVMAGGSAGVDLSYTDPIHIDRVAADFPELKIVVSHGGWPWVHPILHIAYRRPNLYVSADQYLANMPGSADYVKAADGFLADRFLFATSYPFTPLEPYTEWFKTLPIRPEAMEKVLYRNAATLLGLNAKAAPNVPA